MKTIKDMTFGGERPLFESHDLRMENITISDGESAIKECTNLEADGCRFFGKYPWWHVDGSVITNCYFAPESRSAIWYSYNMTMRDCVIDGPKFFREMKNVELENVTINDADETFWNVENLKLKKRNPTRWHLPLHGLPQRGGRRTGERLKICIPVC